MDKLSLKGHWNAIKGQLKKSYANLTDDDLMYQEGQEDELLGRIQKRTGAAKEEIERMISGFSKNNP
jgi:uncharacterized protein YjbJ (UPF0337 family)